MKTLILTLTIICIFLFSSFVFSQSSMEFQAGTTIEVQTGADICANTITINGTYYGAGTKCGGTLFIPANTKIFLQGPYSAGSMTTALRTAGYIPLTQPYSGAPWSYSGTETVSSIPANVTDWVLVQLRSDATTVVATRAGFVKSDGTIVDVDGSDYMRFNVAAGSYYVVVKHRNHLGVMSSATVAQNTSHNLYDFTTAQAQAYGISPMKALTGGSYGLYSGDGNASGGVTATDKNAVWRAQNGTMGYLMGDFNLSNGVTASDKNGHWRLSNGIITQIP